MPYLPARVLHPRSAYDKKLHNGTRVHERAQVLLDKYHAMLAGVVTPLRASEITQIGEPRTWPAP